MGNKISIGILVYNHDKFIEQCLKSVLAISYDSLEIIVSDDCSSDSSFEIIKACIKNNPFSHQIILNRNKENLGLIGNFNKTFNEIATGDFLVTLGGDDVLKDNYLEEALQYFEKNDAIMMCDFSADIIDEKGILKRSTLSLDFESKTYDLEDYLSNRKISTFAPGRMIRKNVIKEFPPISLTCPTEDSIIVVRSLLIGKIKRINKKVILYRRHNANLSNKHSINNFSNTEIITQYIYDALCLFRNNRLTDKQILKLLRRFDLEYNLRRTLYSKTNYYLKAIILRFYKYHYILFTK